MTLSEGQKILIHARGASKEVTIIETTCSPKGEPRRAIVSWPLCGMYEIILNGTKAGQMKGKYVSHWMVNQSTLDGLTSLAREEYMATKQLLRKGSET